MLSSFFVHEQQWTMNNNLLWIRPPTQENEISSLVFASFDHSFYRFEISGSSKSSRFLKHDDVLIALFWSQLDVFKGFLWWLYILFWSCTGFISLDCGLVPKETTYTEKSTNITYKSDVDYIDSGLVGKINDAYKTQFQQQVWAVRSFPVGQRNCYNVNLTANNKYLIRGTFVYGNYDGLNQFPSFDLHIGPNKWSSVKILGVTNTSMHEIIHVVPQDSLEVCLVKTGPTTPFISSLEVRPLNNESYLTQSGSLMLFARVYFPSSSSSFIR